MHNMDMKVMQWVLPDEGAGNTAHIMEERGSGADTPPSLNGVSLPALLQETDDNYMRNQTSRIGFPPLRSPFELPFLTR
jgi:hypothetical protein